MMIDNLGDYPLFNCVRIMALSARFLDLSNPRNFLIQNETKFHEINIPKILLKKISLGVDIIGIWFII